MSNSRITFFVVLAVSVALAAGYVQRRQLKERHTAFLQSEREIEAAQSQIGELEQALAAEEARARDLATDPVEVEAAVRRLKRAAHSGETLLRVEYAPEAPPTNPAPPTTEAIP